MTTDAKTEAEANRIPIREEWQLSCFIDTGAAYGSHLSESDQKALKYVLSYRDEDGDMQTGRTIWPSDPLYPKCRELVTCYEDECRIRPASEMPDWAVRRWLHPTPGTGPAERREGA